MGEYIEPLWLNLERGFRKMLLQVLIEKAGEKKPSIEIHPLDAETNFLNLYSAVSVDSGLTLSKVDICSDLQQPSWQVLHKTLWEHPVADLCSKFRATAVRFSVRLAAEAKTVHANALETLMQSARK